MATQLLKDLRALNGLFKTKATHTKREYALSGTGRSVHGTSKVAVRWCLAGGIDGVTSDNPARVKPLRDAIRAAIRASTPWTFIIGFNDDPSTTFTAVKGVIRKAIDAERAHG